MSGVVAIFFGTNVGVVTILGAQGFVRRGGRRLGEFLVPVSGRPTLKSAVMLIYVLMYLTIVVLSMYVVWVAPRAGAGADLKAVAAIGAGTLFATASTFFFGKTDE